MGGKKRLTKEEHIVGGRRERKSEARVGVEKNTIGTLHRDVRTVIYRSANYICLWYTLFST